MTETETMNLLQAIGIISDLCVDWKDIAKADLEKAKTFLKQHAN